MTEKERGYFEYLNTLSPASFVETLNNEHNFPLEGVIVYDLEYLKVLIGHILTRYKKREILSLNEKIEIRYYLSNGKKCEYDIDKLFPVTIEIRDVYTYDCIFEKIFGVGTKAHKLYILGPGFLIIDLEKIDKHTSDDLIKFHETNTCGGYMKAGKVVKYLFKDIDISKVVS